MEVFIPIVIILFIFSLISERVVNFLKLNLPEVSDQRKILGIFPGGPFRTKTNDSSCEKIRERRIFWLAILSALVVSFASKANLFSMLRYMGKANDTLWWSGTRESISGFKEGNVEIIAGCILTALFISLGSKFWHDLLDLLFFTKNLKEKLSNKNTFSSETIEQLDEFIQIPELKLAQLALDQKGPDLRSIAGVLSVGIGYLKTGGSKVGCLEIHVVDSQTADSIENQAGFQLPSKREVSLPIKKVVTGFLPKVSSLQSGGAIANQDKFLGWGTAGAIVRDNVTHEKYILSCFHVLKGKGTWKGLSDSKIIIVKEGNTEKAVGKLKFGCRTEELDIGLATLDEGVNFSNQFISGISGIRDVLPRDALREIGVRILGAATGTVVFGYVYNDSWPAKLQYPDNSTWDLKDLFLLTRVNMQTNQLESLTKGGDSGALVVTDDNYVIGMVVGGDKAFTYAIKMEKIAKNFDISI